MLPGKFPGNNQNKDLKNEKINGFWVDDNNNRWDVKMRFKRLFVLILRALAYADTENFTRNQF